MGKKKGKERGEEMIVIIIIKFFRELISSFNGLGLNC